MDWLCWICGRIVASRVLPYLLLIELQKLRFLGEFIVLLISAPLSWFLHPCMRCWLAVHFSMHRVMSVHQFNYNLFVKSVLLHNRGILFDFDFRDITRHVHSGLPVYSAYALMLLNETFVRGHGVVRKLCHLYTLIVITTSRPWDLVSVGHMICEVRFGQLNSI